MAEFAFSPVANMAKQQDDPTITQSSSVTTSEINGSTQKALKETTYMRLTLSILCGATAIALSAALALILVAMSLVT